VGGWTPAQLFLASEQGAWYDPSDFSTMFQDSAGSTPVTAVEQPVGKILDKSGRGNHASQSTAASRPVLSARKNLLQKTEDFSSADWIKTEVSVSMAGAVATITPSITADTHRVTNNEGTVNGTQTISVEVKPAGYTKVALKESMTTGHHASFDLTGAGSVLNMSAANATIALLPDGYYRLSMTVITTGPVGRQLSILAPAYTSGDPNLSIFAGDGTSGVLVRYPQCEFGVSATRYQRVNTATDYDTVGFPLYLKFDGVDDFLSTSSIDFTSTDKMTVVAGVQKLSDAADGAIAEYGPTSSATAGTFGLLCISAGTSIQSNLFGTTGAIVSIANGASPVTFVSAQAIDIGAATGSENAIRLNGGAWAQAASAAGTGNFTTQPLYIGRRAGSSLPFNGNLYQLVIRGALTADLTPGETFTSGKTGITL